MLSRLSRQNQVRRRGLTLIESMAALAMLAIVGAAMMLSTQTAVTATSQSIDEMIAAGIAAQYLDEAMGLPYCDPTATSTDPNNVLSSPLGHGTSSLRGDWVDLDDYAGVQDNDCRTPHVESPPLDPWGRTLGSGCITKTNTRHPNFAVRSDFFTGWRLESNVYYVADTNVAAPKNESSYLESLSSKSTEIAATVRSHFLPVFIEYTVMCRRVPNQSARQGISLVEMMVASVVMVLVAGSMAMLARAVQSGSEYSQKAFDVSQNGRVCLDRMQRTMRRAFANDSFPGIVAFSATEGSYVFPDTVVVWDPPSGTPTDPKGFPRLGELKLYSPSSTEPNKLLEITLPNDTTIVPILSNTALWETLVTTLKDSQLATRRTITSRLRTSKSGTLTRGNVRFDVQLRPSDEALATYRSLPAASQNYANWRKLPWPQDLYSKSSGMRQVRCRIELQMIPESTESTASNAIPFFDSVALYYMVQP